jgi:hypothetical protein
VRHDGAIVGRAAPRTHCHDVQFAHAAGRVPALVDGFGTRVPIAARHFARRLALEVREVLGGTMNRPARRR